MRGMYKEHEGEFRGGKYVATCIDTIVCNTELHERACAGCVGSLGRGGERLLKEEVHM